MRRMDLRCITIHKKRGKDMENNAHKISFKISENPVRVEVYIDRDRICPIGLYPLNKDGHRLSEEEMEKLEPDFAIDCAELEVRNIRDIAVAMNEETFNQFCELWREFHDSGGK